MRVLVIGQGGREHALVRALKLSPSVREVHVLPGSHGMAHEALCHPLATNDVLGIKKLLQRLPMDLVVIGPEAPLSEGLADALRAEGHAVFGPGGSAAQLEASKIFAKEFMVRAEIPTARYEVATTLEELNKAAKSFKAPYVLKADGLAAGKGVFVCSTLQELETAGRALFIDKKLGPAGLKAILEEFQAGVELSYLLLTNGIDYRPLPLARDHKRLQDGDQGPNTGGMGTIAPIAIDERLDQEIKEKILLPSIRAIHNANLLYRGLLYVGIMLTANGPKVLEYNVRFGDPEAQVLLPLLDGDWGKVFLEVAKGNLPELNWLKIFASCVVLAAEGYPDQPVRGAPIGGDVFHQTPSSYFLHAGTRKNEAGFWQTDGGRVLNAIGIGSTASEALRHAYEQSKAVSWNGLQKRRDIGEKST